MSLHKFAEQVASQGRGDDSLLVHMTPDEVRNLQKFAQANGTTLTINPTTGLPEAGMLSDLFKAIAPIALGAFLGPAGFGMSSMMAGLTTGGITTLATGSLSRGLMAGLGAYGGSGLADSFMNAGANTVGNVAGALGVEGAATGAGSQAAMLAAQNAGFGAEGLSSLANSAGVAAGATPVVPSTSSLLSSGFKAATANPAAMGTFAKQNLANIGMAAAPLLAMQPTTKMPEPKDTGYIRQFDYNINPDTGKPDPLYGMRAMTPIKASEFGNKTFQGQRDLFRQQNPNPYELGVGSLNQPPQQQQQQPTPMAGGGIVALAGGGMPGYAPGGFVPSDEDIFNYFKTPGLTDEIIARDMRTFNLSPADVARATGTQNQLADYEQRFAAQAIPEPVAPATTVATTPYYFQVNPDVAAAFTQNSYGMTPEAFAQAHYDKYGKAEGREVAPAAPAAPVDYFAQQFAPDVFTPEPAPVYTPEPAPVYTPEPARPSRAIEPEDTYVPPVAPTGIETLTAAMPPVTTPTQPPAGIETLTAPVTPTAPTALPVAAAAPYYFQVNPDVAKAYAENSYGMTPEAFAQAHYDKYGKAEGREVAPSAAVKYATENKTDIVANTLKWIDTNPFATPDQINAAIEGSGMSTGDVNRALDALVTDGKISGSERYYIQQGKGLSAMADSTAKWLKEHPDATQDQIDKVLKAASMDTGDAQQVLAHGFQVADKDLTAATKYIQDNPDVARWVTSAQGQAYIKEHPEFDANDIAYTHYKRYGEKEGRQWGATPPPLPSVVPGGTQLPGATVYDNGAFGNYGSGPATGVDYRGNTVSIATPGDIITNPDQTRTVVPNIPGRPYGGFTGSEQVKSRYTAGGGSLGYTAPIPKDPQTAFNKLTDDSLDAYNFLMGKGKNLTQRKAETRDRPVMQRYDEAVLGRKIPKLVKTTTPAKTDTKETVAGDTAVVGGVNFDLTDPTKAPAEDNNGPWSWDVPSKRWVQYGKMASGGMTGYAIGGGLGSLGSYSDGGRLLKGPGDGVSDSIPATIGAKNQPARLADGEFVIPARIVSELGNGSTDAGAKKLYAMMDRVQRARGKTTGKNKVAANSRSDKYLPA